MKRRITDLKNDVLFKYIFGKDNEISKKLLKVLIEGVLQIPVNDLTVMNPELSPEHLDDRDLILDIRAKDENGKFFDVEMQSYGPSKIYKRRFSQYGHKLAGELYHEGEMFLEERKVYQILFVDCLNPKSNELIRVFKMRDDHGEEDDDLLVKAYVYIKQMKEYIPSDPFKSLVYLFNHPDKSDILKSGNEMISMVENKINEFNEDEELADLAFRRKLDQIFKNSLEQEVKEAREEKKQAEEDLKLAKEQVKAVKEQIKMVEEQAKAAKEQVKDAKEQVKDAKEQAKAAKEQAKAAKEQVKAAQEQAKAAQEQAKAAEEQTKATKEQIKKMQTLTLEKIHLLNQKLKEDQRIDDLLKASTDLVYQRQLMKEYGIEE